MNDRVRAIAPATVANIGPGFDVLGLALDGPYDQVEAERTEDGLVTLVDITGDDGALPRSAQDNCVGAVARAVLTTFGEPGAGVRLWLHKGLPPGSGLGSSAASSVAAAVATAAVICPEAFQFAKYLVRYFFSSAHLPLPRNSPLVRAIAVLYDSDILETRLLAPAPPAVTLI